MKNFDSFNLLNDGDIDDGRSELFPESTEPTPEELAEAKGFLNELREKEIEKIIEELELEALEEEFNKLDYLAGAAEPAGVEFTEAETRALGELFTGLSGAEIKEIFSGLREKEIEPLERDGLMVRIYENGVAVTATDWKNVYPVVRQPAFRRSFVKFAQKVLQVSEKDRRN